MGISTSMVMVPSNTAVTIMSKNLICTFGVGPLLSKELWAPYYEEIAKQTVNAAQDHDKVVLTHATYLQEARDVVIETIVAPRLVPSN